MLRFFCFDLNVSDIQHAQKLANDAPSNFHIGRFPSCSFFANAHDYKFAHEQHFDSKQATFQLKKKTKLLMTDHEPSFLLIDF